MSLPLLGNEIDLKGSLTIDHQILSKGNYFVLKIKSFDIINNEIYKSYFNSKKIGIEVRLTCDSTFLEKFLVFDCDSDNDEMEISFKKLDVNNKIQISYYLKSLENFQIKPDKEYFNEFFNSPIPVIHNSFMSEIYNAQINISNNNSLVGTLFLMLK